MLIQAVCLEKPELARSWAKNILESGLKTEKDRKFCEDLLEKLKDRENARIPYNLEHILSSSMPDEYRPERFLLREKEATLVETVLETYHAAQTLEEAGVSYTASLMLQGPSGCGKTELAKYIAYRANLPFVYVRFSGLMDSLLGKTQQNLNLIFHFFRSHPCVLCLDEVDAIGLVRGQNNDSGELNRVTISLMQELDHMPNNGIIIATTNRFSDIDKALVRRFNLVSEITPLSADECEALAKQYFQSVHLESVSIPAGWAEGRFQDGTPASTVIRECTMQLVKEIVKDRS